jgi:hypothetical protein
VAGELGWVDLSTMPMIGGFPIIVKGALASLLLYVAVSMLTPPGNRNPVLDDGA